MARSTKAPRGRVAAPAPPVLTFVEAAHEHTEPGGFDFTCTIGAAVQQFGPFDVPAFGFLRSIAILVTNTGGTAGPGTLSADAPWNLFTEITLLDVNGGQMFGPMDGYSAMLANKWGGYAFRNDPTSAPDAVTSGVVTFSFMLRIPVEINGATGLGSLANQNAAAAYKVRLGVNTAVAFWGTQPTAPPTTRIRGILEAWTQPAEVDPLQRRQMQAPPAHGTAQFWTLTTRTLNAGDNIIQLSRMGNLIRSLIFVVRTAGGARQGPAFTNMPDPIDLRWDARQVTNEAFQYRRTVMSERSIPGTINVEDGVVVYDFSHDLDGHIGFDEPTLWLATVQATRFEIHASNFAVGQLQILTNDVAPVEVNPNDRFVDTSQTGFHPRY
jgi:hypothetical protein